MRTIEEVKKDIEFMEDKIYERKIGNDMYYSSYQYTEDQEHLNSLKNELKHLQENHEVYNG